MRMVRITPKRKKLLKQAADLRGRSLTDPMIESAEKEAEIAVEEGVVIRFTAEQHDQLIDALLNPPEPNNALKEAAQRYDRADIISR